MNDKKAIGLIAEFNPFHRGHKYYIKKAKTLDKDAILICAMSPNFVQRGEFAIYPKEKRVRQALKNGVDIVVEIPTIFALQSAEIYAAKSLEILNFMHVDQILFGTESGNTEEFLSKFENHEFSSPRMDELIQSELSKGNSYASSKAKAMKQIDDFYLENPNDILGYEYLKAINKNKYRFKVNCYKRKEAINVSASKIRKSLLNIDIFHNLSCNEYYFKELKYKLLTTPHNELSKIHLVDEGIEFLFLKNILKAPSMRDFIDLCTSKRYSRARLKRTVMHILLNNKKEETSKMINSKIPYLRILGFSKKGSEYLRVLKNKFNPNIVTRFSAKDNLLLLDELKATSLYNINKSNKVLLKKIEQEKTLYPIHK